jgi:uncharacterized membrane protein
VKRRPAASARLAVSRAISIVATVVVLLIVAGILLIVLEANRDNGIVSFVTDVAETLVGPFEELFTLDDRKTQVAVNWGIAAVVYFVVGRVLAAVVAP